MIELNHWHPVATAAKVAQVPFAAVLLGRSLVLWRGVAGQLHAWADQCPHRGARFSLGRVIEVLSEGRLAASRLECAYHGWQFDAAGQCQHVPALPGFVPPTQHCAKTYEVCEQYGLVWVRLAAKVEPVDGFHAAPVSTLPSVPSFPPVPAFAGAQDAASRQVLCGPHQVATSAPRVVENFLDMAHFGFVHEGFLGDRAHAQVPSYDVSEHAHGMVATRCVAYQPKSSVHAAGGEQVEYVYEVIAPYSAVLTKVPMQHSVGVAGNDAWVQMGGSQKRAGVATDATEFRESIALFVCPISPESSAVWFCISTRDRVSSQSDLIAFQDTIFQQDKPVLESQNPKRLPLDPLAERHTAADKASAAYRRYLRRLGVEFGTCFGENQHPSVESDAPRASLSAALASPSEQKAPS